MEIRFMPSLARDINQIGFILNLNNEYGKKLLENDINDVNFNKDISKNFLRNDLNKDFFTNKDKLELLKKLFPNVYICNLYGKLY